MDNVDELISWYSQYPASGILRLLRPCRGGYDLREVKKHMVASPKVKGIRYYNCEHVRKEAMLSALRRFYVLGEVKEKEE